MKWWAMSSGGFLFCRKPHQVLSTPGGNAAIKDVTVSLFGARYEKGSIIDIVQQNPDEAICALYGISDQSDFENIKLVEKMFGKVLSKRRLLKYVSGCSKNLIFNCS